MSIFSQIKDAIFGHPKARPQQSTQAARPSAMPQMAPAQRPAPASAAQQAAPAQQVDVEAVLTEIAQSKGQQLNWRTSIVDLMKLLDLDPSLANRQELATELGYTGEKNGSAEMNTWLHRRVIAELEKNGGKVPGSMKD
jgi:3-oxoacyl-ACP reductase-like protein